MDRVRRPSSGRAAAVGALLIGMLLALGMAPVAAEAATSTSKVQIVLENPDLLHPCGRPPGTSYGVNANAAAAGGKYRLFRSDDEGRTWAPTHDFPASTRIYGLSVLSCGNAAPSPRRYRLLPLPLFRRRPDAGRRCSTSRCSTRR